MASSTASTVPLGVFVDTWLEALENAKASAEASGLSENSKLHEDKYIKDLLDALSWQLRNYIEHPDPNRPGEKITLSQGKLVVAKTDLNLSDETRRARLKHLMQKILEEKGTDGGKRYQNLKSLLEGMTLAPTALAKDARWKAVDTQWMKDSAASPAKYTQYYFDPADVDDKLEAHAIWASGVNMQDIDQFRNKDGRFNKTMKAHFGLPNYRTINQSLVDEATERLGRYTFVPSANAKPASRANINKWVKNRTPAPASRANINQWVKNQNNRISKNASALANLANLANVKLKGNQNTRNKKTSNQNQKKNMEHLEQVVNMTLADKGLVTDNPAAIANKPTAHNVAVNATRPNGDEATVAESVEAAEAVKEGLQEAISNKRGSAQNTPLITLANNNVPRIGQWVENKKEGSPSNLNGNNAQTKRAIASAVQETLAENHGRIVNSKQSLERIVNNPTERVIGSNTTLVTNGIPSTAKEAAKDVKNIIRNNDLSPNLAAAQRSVVEAGGPAYARYPNRKT